MATSDPIGDLLSRIRNGQMRGLAKITTPASKLRGRLLDVLKSEGFIRGYAEVEYTGGKSPARKEFEVELKYHEGRPVIRELTRISKPGRRVYNSVDELKPYRGGLGISILSTPRGVMSDADAREKNVGGEVLCQVF
jgi:small subunit ribosomal protein S8